jgi:POT family proton-dependent oligopeptide transporter
MVKAAGLAAGGTKSPVYWLVLTYLVHTFGELCLSPVGLSTVTKLAPARFVGQMMGVWFLASSLGKLTAGLIAGTFDPNDVAAMPGRYMNIVIYGCSVGLLLLLISRPVTRLMGGVR